MKLTSTILALPALFALAAPAAASEYEVAMRSYFDANTTDWRNAAELVEAVIAQNARTGGYSADEITQLDAAWQAEIGAAATPTITEALETPLADFLRAQVAASGGALTEIIVMDAKGLNVAVSAVTSDYWQGDEAKHQDTFGIGPGAVHFSEVEFDESTQTYQAQISYTLVDPATGEAIGAVTLGVDAQALM